MLCVLVARWRLGIDVLFKDLTGSKRHDSTRGDPNFFAGPWIASFAGSLAPYDKISEACNLDGVPFLQHSLQQIEYQLDDIGCIILGHSNLLENFVRDIRLSHAFPPAIH